MIALIWVFWPCWPLGGVAGLASAIRACQLGDLRWSTLPFGDGNETLRFNGNEKGRATTRGI
jgi:hypothetical protein